MKNKVTALFISFLMAFSSAVPTFSGQLIPSTNEDVQINTNEEENLVVDTDAETDTETEKTVETEADTTTQGSEAVEKTTSNEAARESVKTADLKASIVFSYPEKLSEINKKGLIVTLVDVGSLSLTNSLLKSGSAATIGSYNVEINPIVEEDLLTEVELKIVGLNRSSYKLRFAGNGHKAYTTNNIDLSKASKKVIIKTDNTTFTIGDVNGDEVVNKDDVISLEKEINKNSKDRKYDLNGDGFVNINDIAFVNHHIYTNGAEIVGSYEYFVEEVVNFDAADEEIKNSNVVVTGADGESASIAELSKSDSVLTLAKPEGTVISEEEPIEIPMTFEEPVEMENIEITAPAGAGSPSAGKVLLELEGEEPMEVDFDNSAPALFSRSRRSVREAGKISIPLGKKVAVKKMTIKVTEVEGGEDGKANFVTVQEVKFLQDIGQNDLGNQVVMVSGLKATVGSEEVSLTWDTLPNVTGYRVFAGESSKVYDQEIDTTINSATVEGLKNLKDYYITVAPLNGEWVGTKAEEIKVTPQPDKAPLKPDNVGVKSVDNQMITLVWGKTKDTLTYNVYYRKTTEQNYTQHATGLTGLTHTINGLENDVEYEMYVTAVNKIGESAPSLTVLGTPKRPEFEIPKIPTLNKMDPSNIEKIEMGHPDHYSKNDYPDGFDPKWLIDGNYATTWIARAWWEKNSFAVTFKKPLDMDYMVWVARLDGVYRRVFGEYKVKVWLEGQDLNGEGKELYTSNIANPATETGYLVLPFEKQENVKKIEVSTAIWAGAPGNANASELIFYHYNDIADRVSGLFADGAFTRLKQATTLEKINKLEEEVNNLEGFIVSRETLLKELELAKALLNDSNASIGFFKKGIQSRKPAQDVTKHGIAINNYEPLGVAAYKDDVINIYADIPTGEEVNLIVTQFFAEAGSFNYSVPLVNGRNEIKIRNASNLARDIGGSLYISYAGDRGKNIKLQVLGGVKIPYLELTDFYSLNEEQVKAKIKTFIDELEEYKKTLTGWFYLQPLNSSEIALPNVLLSLPADKVLEGIKEGLSTDEQKIQRVYENILAWEEIMKTSYKVFGIDDYKKDGLQTRHNIRYMRMFANAFMYAAGNHIGVGYESSKDLMKGRPTSTLATDAEANDLFGWGIAHEIGHVMDRLGRAEVTNNVYSLIAQTLDGKNNTLPSRLEESEYKDVYDKVSYISKGEPNNGIVALAMYWQLHLAYDDADSTEFYNKVYKKYIKESNKYAAFTGTEKFAVVASEVANKDLTEYFTRYGVSLGDEAKAKLKALPKEDRAIYYLNDDSRRERLKGTTVSVTEAITAKAAVNDENPKEVNIIITDPNEDGKILGYEIRKNGKSIAFTTEKTYTDLMGSANNLSFEYKIVPITILGGIEKEVNAGEIRISYENVIDPSKYTTKTEDNVFTATMNQKEVVSGLMLTLKDGQTMPEEGKLTVKVKSEVDETANAAYTVARKVKSDTEEETEEGTVVEEYIVAKSIDFATTENLSKDKERKFLVYLNKPGVESTDTRIWNYDAKEVQISGMDNLETLFDISLLSYPGDNIEFNDIAFGKLGKDYQYGTEEDEVIEAGTLIITGTYRGEPIYNTMKVKGKFLQGSGLDEEAEKNIIERDINGYSLFFAEPLKQEVSTTISDGIFIFVPDVQAEAELQGSSCDLISVLPIQVKAELYRSDDIEGKVNSRITSDTIWVNTPDIATMPEITLD